MTTHGVYKLQVNGYLADEREFAPDNTAYQKFYNIRLMISLLTWQREGMWSASELPTDGGAAASGATGDSCQYGNKLGLLIQTERFYIQMEQKKYLPGKMGYRLQGL